MRLKIDVFSNESSCFLLRLEARRKTILKLTFFIFPTKEFCQVDISARVYRGKFFFFSFFAWGKSCYVERGWKSKNNEYDDIVCQNTFVTLRNFTLTKPNFSKLSWNQRVQLVTLVGADFTKYFSSESFSHKFQSFFFVKLRISFSSFEGSCFHEKNRLDLFSKIFFLMCVQSKTT